jgi:NTE family protein
MASASVPGFFPPVNHEGMLLSDAGLINNMPVLAARALGAEVIIAVNLSAHIEAMQDFTTGIEVVFRNEEIGAKIMNDLKAQIADVIISPNLAHRYWLDFEDLDGILEAGEQAAMQSLGDLHRKVKERKFDLGA